MSTNASGKALKSGVWYTIANFMTRGIAFLSMPIFNRQMSKADIGDYSNFTSWLTIIASVITVDLYTSVTIAKFEFKEKIDEYVSSVLMLGSFITLFFYGVAYLFKGLIFQHFGFNEMELHVLFLYSLVSPALQMFQIRNRLDYKYKLSTFLSLSSVFLSTGISLLCVLTLSEKLTGRLLGFYGPLMAMNLCIYLYLLSKSKKINLSYWKFGLKISIPMVWHVLAAHLLSASDRIMIRNICGSEQNADYTVAYTCSMVVSILFSSMNAAWSPWAFEQMDAENYGQLKKASRPYLLFFGLVVFGSLLLAPELLLIMGGKPYLSALGVIPPVMVAFVFQFVYSLYVNIETFSKKQKNIAFGTSVAALVNVGLNYLLIPKFGYVAAAYTTLVGYAVLFMIHFLFVTYMKKNGWYDTKFNFAFLFFFVIMMFVMMPLYRYTVLRYILIAAFGVGGISFMVIFREELKYLVKHKSTKKLMERLQTIRKGRNA